MTFEYSYNSTSQAGYRKITPPQVNLLEQLNDPKYDGFLGEFRNRSLTKGQLFCAPGEATNEVFIAITGRIRVYLSYEDREFTLCYLLPGDIYSTHTRAFVEASKQSTVLTISAAKFAQRVMAFPDLSILMTGILGEMLSSTLDILDGLIFHDVRYRLIEFLLSLAKNHGQNTEQGLEFICDLNMEDIAMLIGCSRQTVSSLLNNLIRDGHLVRVNRDHFLVKKIDALEALLVE